MNDSSQNNTESESRDILDDLTDNELRGWILGQTSRIYWPELQRAFARGMVLSVNADLDLIEVALAMVRDRCREIQALHDESVLSRTPDSQAIEWLDRNPQLWAVVVPPWVLVQEPDHPLSDGADDDCKNSGPA